MKYVRTVHAMAREVLPWGWRLLLLTHTRFTTVVRLRRSCVDH